MAWNIARFSSLPTAPRIQAPERFQTKNHTPVLEVKPTSSEKNLPPCKVARSEGVTDGPSLTVSPRISIDPRCTKSSPLPSLGMQRIPPLPCTSKPSWSSARTQLDLLEQLTSSTSPGSSYECDGDTRKPTIREQLDELVGDKEDDFSLPLGKRLQASRNSLTISQRRSIKRQAYLNEVARRNDSIFFATIGAFVILPPIVILSIAILTGYVQLFP